MQNRILTILQRDHGLLHPIISSTGLSLRSILACAGTSMYGSGKKRHQLFLEALSSPDIWEIVLSEFYA